MQVSRRTALKALALPAVTGVTGLGAAGCGTGGQSVIVAVVWTGWELRQFEHVMDAFSRNYGIGYQLLSMGDDTGAFLGSEVTAAAQPDVALVPQPGNVRGSQPRLVPVHWPHHDAPSWRGLLAAPGGAQYGVWFKAAYESMVWHTDDLTVPDGGWDWDTWAGQCRALAAAGRPPLAIGAADGWVLAGWFANALLSIDPGTYRYLAREYANGRKKGTGPTWDNPSVRKALYRIADVWRIDRAFPGGAERALVTQFDQSVLDVFASREAAMVVGADYFWPIITQSTRFPPARVRWFPFPGGAGEQAPVMVAGDAAVLFRRPGVSQPGKTLIQWLGSPEAARIWAKAGGFLSINDQVTEEDYSSAYPPTMNRGKLIGSVRRPSAEFNLADLLGGPLGGSDGAGMWKIFTDFFTAVALNRSPVPAAVDAAVSALDRGQGGA